MSWRAAWQAARPGIRRRVRTPTLLQMEAVECGAACLGMVLAAFGRHVPLEELRLACGVSRDGTKASNLVRAARAYGLVARGFTKEPDGLPALPLPLIVFWNFNHFVVVEGFGPRQVAINDPASGPRLVSREEFDQSFTGVVLTFEPGPDFARGGAPRSALAGLRARLAGGGSLGGGGLLSAGLATLALLAPGLLIPALTRAFVDGMLAPGGLGGGRLAPLAWAMLAATLANGLLTYLQQTALLRLEHSLALRMSGDFLWHVLRLPASFFTQRAPGEIAARVRLNDTLAELLSARLATALFNGLLVAFYGLVLFSYDAPLALIGVAAAGVNLAVLRLAARRRIDSTHKLLQDAGKLMGTAAAGLAQIETVKASGAEAALWQRWAGHHAQVEQARQRQAAHTQLLALAPALLLALTGALTLTLGALRVIDGRLTVGGLAAVQALMLSFIAPIQSLVNLGGELQEAQAGLARLDDALRSPIDPALDQPPAAATAEAPLSGRLEVSGLSFGYGQFESPLLSDVDLAVAPGGRVAIVGGSGSGKSTLARLIAGLHQPWAGAIRFDGKPRGEIEPAALRRAVALVEQEPFLFAGSLRDNLTLWDPAISDAELLAAAEDADIAELLAGGGLDQPVAEGGRNFSGGQRQRLELARALARAPRLLILDEATNALDPIAERRIEAALRRRGCACLVIAHRLNTVRDCDEIIVLDQGQIVQRGVHAALVSQPGLYAQLIEAA